MTFHYSTPIRSRGASLLEVLIAALVIAIGLLAIGALQFKSLQSTSSAQYRAKATDLAWALADRMRANLPGADNYITGVAADCSAPADICAMAPDAADATGVTSCTPAQMAAFDLYEIRCSDGVRTALPGGTLAVSCIDSNTADGDPCSDVSPFNIEITWEGTRSDEDNNREQFAEQLVMTVIPGTEK